MNTTSAENPHPPIQKTKYVQQDVNQANTYIGQYLHSNN